MNFLGWTEAQIEQLIDDVYKGVFSIKSLPPKLYDATLEKLTDAIIQGFGSFDTPELQAPLTSLLDGIAVFSGAKTFQQVRDLESKIFDASGSKMKLKDFKEEATKVFETYNDNYLKTEFNTAVSRSRAVREWENIQTQKNIFPLLKYITVGDDRVRGDHILLDEIVRPVDDAFWDTFYPPNGWNCRCIVEQLEQGEEPVTDLRGKKPPTPTKLFNNNPAKTGLIFDDKAHPYFKVDKRFKIAPRTKDGKVQIIDAKPKKKLTKKSITTKKQAKEAITSLINNSTSLKVNKVSFSSKLTAPQIERRVNKLEELVGSYNISESTTSLRPTDISFISTKRVHGSVRSGITSNKQRIVSKINFGHTTDSGAGRVPQTKIDGYKKVLRNKSRVDPENLEVATVVHEFAHVISTENLRSLGSNVDRNFFRDLSSVRQDYYKEINDIRDRLGVKSTEKIYDIHLGRYAGTNINEFMAEAFTEYKLSSSPTKYAKIVGKLIDKYYKK